MWVISLGKRALGENKALNDGQEKCPDWRGWTQLGAAYLDEKVRLFAYGQRADLEIAADSIVANCSCMVMVAINESGKTHKLSVECFGAEDAVLVSPQELMEHILMGIEAPRQMYGDGW